MRRPRSERYNRCGFCGCVDRPDVAHRNTYAPMLRMDLWRRLAGPRNVAKLMCTACMMKRLGRPFIAYDFRWPWWPYQLEQKWRPARRRGEFMMLGMGRVGQVIEWSVLDEEDFA